MDWKPLLDPATTYRGEHLTAAAVDARVTQARACFRTHVEALGRLEQASTAGSAGASSGGSAVGTPAVPTVLGGLGGLWAAAVGPGAVSTAWRGWREARARPEKGALEKLEQSVEEAQRQVSRLAAWIDALAREEAAVRREMEALRRCVADAAADHAIAHSSAEASARGLAAIDLVRARALPTEGAALDADAAVLEGLTQARAADARAFARAADRLSAVLGFGGEALASCARLRTALERVHGEGTDVLHELDLHLRQLAAEARAADLGQSLAAGMDTLRGSVGRVHLQAREGADVLLDRLDRLAEAPDLLAPADPARAAAESEVSALVANRRV
ncbi:MAG: hypothetical protein Q8P18_14225 [Pseudomonadota bacterium]|nr:hypothetical protein [Pseudomonadota bacterium]